MDDHTNDELAARAGALATAVESLTKRVRRGRTQIILLAVSVTFDLILSAGFFYSLHNVAQTANSQHAACVTANVTAAKEIQLWQGILNLPKAPDQPATNPVVLAQFNKLLADTFQQQKC